MVDASSLIDLEWLRNNVHGGSWKRMIHDLRLQLTDLPRTGGHVKIRDQIKADIQVIQMYAKIDRKD